MAAGPHVIEVNDADFQAKVLDESHRRPVMVDFWAPWCGPCRMLGPVLERLADEAGGGFLLAKLNTDVSQQTALAFKVSGIPDVKVFKDGKVVDGFVGALPERQVRLFLERVVPGPANAAIAEATRLLASGDLPAAKVAYEKALTLREDYAPALFALAHLAMKGGERDVASGYLARITPDEGSKLGPGYAQLKLLLEAGSIDLLKARVAANPDDHDAAIELGRALAAAGLPAEGLASLLGVVKKLGRNGAGEKARAAMIEVFGALGGGSEVVSEWRGKLAAELYK